jgi:hypothetical protein
MQNDDRRFIICPLSDEKAKRRVTYKIKEE